MAELAKNLASREEAVAIVMSHADLRLADVVTFDPTTLSELSGIPVERVEKAFRALSLRPGALAEQRLEFLYLDNPVWLAPVVAAEGAFFVPIPQAILSHIHPILRRLARSSVTF